MNILISAVTLLSTITLEELPNIDVPDEVGVDTQIMKKCLGPAKRYDFGSSYLFRHPDQLKPSGHKDLLVCVYLDNNWFCDLELDVKC